MFNNFSVSADKVMQLAEKEARALNHEYVGTEHILLGLVKEGRREKRSLVHKILSRCGVNYKKIRSGIKEKLPPGPESVITIGRLPITPRGKRVIEYAIEQTRSLNRRKVRIEDLLVGLVREKESIAYTVLKDCGVEVAQILRILAPGVMSKGAQEEKVSTAPLTKKMIKQTKRLASVIEKKKKERPVKKRPVKSKIFKVVEKAVMDKKVLKFKAAEAEFAPKKVETAITDFLSGGKELVEVVQSSVSFGLGLEFVFTQITILYREKGS